MQNYYLQELFYIPARKNTFNVTVAQLNKVLLLRIQCKIHNQGKLGYPENSGLSWLRI